MSERNRDDRQSDDDPSLEGLSPGDLLGAAMDFGSSADADDEEDESDCGFHPPAVAAIDALFPMLKVTQLIGRGGMGAVYKATQISLNREIALKILPVRHRRSAQFEERFHREAQALARLNHPNIVTIYDFGQVKELFYFVMEYVNGSNLAQLMRQGKLTLRSALSILPQICDALGYAHETSVVHRDIKPGNILVDQRGRVKVVDFGLAKLLDDQPKDLALTRASQFMGTPHYMAPEQIDRPLEVDHRADIYSLGVVFYEMLTGRLPTGRFPPPSEKVPIDARLDVIVMKALETDPENRYQTISEISSGIRETTDSKEAQLGRPNDDDDPPSQILALRSGANGAVLRLDLSMRVLWFISGISAVLLLALIGWLGGWKALAVVSLLFCLGAGLVCWISWWYRKRERMRSEGLLEGIRQLGRDSLVADPGEEARLEDLRHTFLNGLKTFKEYGKDIYELPWYVMVGEPGAGKTEAIRHSSIRFPEALQDRFQGVGGTYSMHWWFTNQAVILDTAGAMLTEEDPSGRFAEFLNLLSTYRPDSPVNGFILAVPVDSLLLDDPIEAETKATAIARRLRFVQEQTGLRFPVYLMVTKSDRIIGFREFFAMEGQDPRTRQMFGWSNDQSLDAEVQADEVADVLRSLSERLRKRRLTLLEEPISRLTDHRRIHEVDALFTFPDAFTQVIDRLEIYLRVLFAEGEWRSLAPYFRGVYFTSSMAEGAALDQELAQALALPPNQLPHGGVWRRDRSLFLRDFFLEKMFVEQGLISRISATGKRVRTSVSRLYLSAAACAAVVLGFAWWSSEQIRSDLEAESYLWKTANREWDNGTLIPILEPSAQNPTEWKFRGDQKVQIAGQPRPLLSLHTEIADRLEKELTGGWFFRPLKSFRRLEKDRESAHRIVLENSIIKPIVEATRYKLLKDPDALPSAADLEAFETLIQLRNLAKTSDPKRGVLMHRLVKQLLQYVAPGVNSDSAVAPIRRLEAAQSNARPTQWWASRDKETVIEVMWAKLQRFKDQIPQKDLERIETAINAD